MRLPTTLAGFLALAALAPAQTVDYDDDQFSAWATSVVWELNGSTGSGVQDTSAGNPAPAWKITKQVANQGSVLLFSEPTDPAGSFDPVAQGPFERVEVSMDLDVVEAAAFGKAVAVVLGARQDGRIFADWCSYTLAWQDDGWTPFGWDRTAPQFRAFDGSGDRLDFRTGGPITFGILTSNSTGQGGGTSETLLDNFSVTVHVGDGLLGTPYCLPSVANSAGHFGITIATGSDDAGGNPLNLRAVCLPANEFGYFIVSETQASISNPGGSQGTLCLGGKIGRFTKQLQNSGTEGEFNIDVDTNALPMPSGPQAIQAGETWNFQCWYRDNNPSSTSNFTDAVSIDFQ